MKAIFRVRRIRDELQAIVGESIWDHSFDDERHAYQLQIDELMGRLENDLVYHDWWGDRERALAAHRAKQQR